jgi:trimeric autotransporter adhesin
MGRATANASRPVPPAPRAPVAGRLASFAAAIMLVASYLPVARAVAFWSNSGEGSGKAVLATLAAPTITSATPGGETVALVWSAVSPPGSGTVEYYVTRDGGTPSSGCPSSTTPSTVTSCTDTGVSVAAHEYTVTARWRGWSATSAPKTVTVTSGPATQLVLEAASTKPVAGEADNLTITAKDASNRVVTSYGGGHALTFEGASEAPSGTKPTVVDSKGTARAFGESTELTFTEGKAQVSSGANGVLKLYKVEEAHVKVKEGSLSNGTGLAVTVSVGVFKSFAVTPVTAEPEAGVSFEVKLTAWDEWHNKLTTYTRTAKLHYEGAESSPSGKAPEYSASTEPTFAAGEASVAGFKLYKAASTTLKVKEETTGHEGSSTFTVKPGAAKRLAWTGAVVSAGKLTSPCLFTCEDATLEHSHTFKASVSVTDEYGNIVTALGVGHTVSLTASAGTLSVSELTIASSGAATSTAAFTFTSQAAGAGSDSIKAATKSGTVYTEAEASMHY